jgi:hypothetical protein
MSRVKENEDLDGEIVCLEVEAGDCPDSWGECARFAAGTCWQLSRQGEAIPSGWQFTLQNEGVRQEDANDIMFQCECVEKKWSRHSDKSWLIVAKCAGATLGAALLPPLFIFFLHISLWQVNPC